MKKNFLNLLLLICGVTAFSQQDAQYTQYMYNTISVNPAYAGSREVLSIFGLHRTQWVGLDGAPVTNSISINSPINDSNLGVGLSFINDRIGPTNKNSIATDISYTIQATENYKLAFGVKGSVNIFNLDVNKLAPETSSDPLLQNFNNTFTPNVGAGTYFYSDKAYLGLSVPNFFQSKRYNDNDVVINVERMNVYLIGGYVFDLSPDLKFKPAFLTKMIQGAPLQIDVSGNFLFNDKFMLGAAWRWSASVSFMAGFQITEGLYLGYGYDLETTKLAKYNSGSHEIFLRFELFNRQSRIVSPRFF